MAGLNIPIRDIPGAIADPTPDNLLAMDNGTQMRKTTVKKVVDSGAPVVSQAGAEAGTDNDARMTALRTKQSIASEVGVSVASKAQGDLASSAVQSVNGKTGSSVNISKADVGLANADNTSDANKPISTATQAALNLKANTSSLGTLAFRSDINNGDWVGLDLSVENGGTGASTAAAARTNLGAASVAQAVPPGGTTGQVLAKTSNADNAVGWTAAGIGDMTKSVYDTTNKNADAFNRANHYGPNVPDDNSVSSAKISSNAVTRTKIETNLSTAAIPYNIQEWGVDGAAFLAANAAVPAGQAIVVPAGTYALGGNRNVSGRRFIFQGTVNITGGKLIGAVIEQQDSVTGTRMFGTGVPVSGSPHVADYKFGDTLNNIVRHGLTIGGGNPDNGTDGTRFSLDSYSGWAVAQNTKYGGAQEFAFQPNAISGVGARYSGENRIYTTYDMFVASHVGKYVYFSDQVYRISVVNGPRDITVTNIDGSAVSWAATREGAAVMMVWVGGTGSGVMAGDTLTRSSGDPFVVKGISKYYVRINGGNIYEVNVWVSPDVITIVGLNLPNGTIVNYEFWTTINHLSSRVVVQRGNGFGGPEECVSLEAYADGKFKLQALSSVGTFPFSANQKPFHIGNGYFTGGGERTHILLDGVAGDTFIGGVYERATLRITNGDNSPTPTGILQYQRPSGSGAPTPNRYFEFRDDSGAIARVPYQRM